MIYQLQVSDHVVMLEP